MLKILFSNRIVTRNDFVGYETLSVILSVTSTSEERLAVLLGYSIQTACNDDWSITSTFYVIKSICSCRWQNLPEFHSNGKWTNSEKTGAPVLMWQIKKNCHHRKIVTYIRTVRVHAGFQASSLCCIAMHVSALFRVIFGGAYENSFWYKICWVEQIYLLNLPPRSKRRPRREALVRTATLPTVPVDFAGTKSNAALSNKVYKHYL